MPQSSLTAWLTPKEPGQSRSSSQELAKSSTAESANDLVSSLQETQDERNQTANKPMTASKAEHQFSDGGSLESAQQTTSQAELKSITEASLPDFKRLVQVLLPVQYSDKFYKEILSDPTTASTTLAAVWKDSGASGTKMVAVIRGRLLERRLQPGQDADDDEPCLYIAAIGTLAPYRGHGLASALLARIVETAIQSYGIRTVAVHVWEANTEAKAWYTKLGFQQVSFEPIYYRRLKPTGAFVLERRIWPCDVLRQAPNLFGNR